MAAGGSSKAVLADEHRFGDGRECSVWSSGATPALFMLGPPFATSD